MERKHTPLYGIKGKLISAVCMLLVAVIMVVSSTYAWFTLSTAPEVSGISTAIGANGALEIKLNGDNAGGKRNNEYGNIVDLSDTTYGLKNITLLPSKLGALNGNLFTGVFLQYPTYGNDGRVGTTFGETQIGSFVNGAFVDNPNATGVRGVGSVSGLSPRQAAYRSASTAASTAMTIAKNKATASLNANGGNLANIVVKKALGSENEANYTQEELGYLETIVTDLSTNVLPQIKTAYESQLKALAASKALDALDLPEGVKVDDVYSTIASAIGDTVTLESVAENDAIVIDTYNIPVTEDLLAGIEAYIATAANVAAAQTAIDNLQKTGGDNMLWANFKTVFDYLMVYDNVSVNGMSPSDISSDKDGFVNKVIEAQMKVTVTMNSGAGVYADIADQCGDYQASITIKNLQYGSITAAELGATMNTDTTRDTNPYLKAALAIAIAAGEPEGSVAGGTMTEMYGFILDLIFRTNAANSDLLLQTTPANRIYKDSANADIMGKGSTMTFASVNLAEFSNNQVKALMENIRIVFFTPGQNNTVIAYAKLDISQAEITAEGVTAPMYLYNGEGLITEQDDAVITSLAQNVDVPVSVLVYLDGESIENGDVAATDASSVTGSMNIQFSSSATLVPMEYGDLREGAAATGNN